MLDARCSMRNSRPPRTIQHPASPRCQSHRPHFAINPLIKNLIIPDLWQQEAVRALRERKDVVVHAPTGAGKTYIFELFLPELRGQAIFTVPTRALANDKLDRKSTRLNSSHTVISYAVFCLKKKQNNCTSGARTFI